MGPCRGPKNVISDIVLAITGVVPPKNVPVNCFCQVVVVVVVVVVDVVVAVVNNSTNFCNCWLL